MLPKFPMSFKNNSKYMSLGINLIITRSGSINQQVKYQLRILIFFSSKHFGNGRLHFYYLHRTLKLVRRFI